MTTPVELYLDLVKRGLLNLLYADLERIVPGIGGHLSVEQARLEGREGLPLKEPAHTLIGRRRLDQLQRAVEEVIDSEVPGDLMECGVWRGGACILMQAVLAARGATGRRLWVADSVRGFPPIDLERYPADSEWAQLEVEGIAVPREEVEDNFRRYGLLGDNVHFLEGYFHETLPTAPVDRLAVLRLDGDYYQSTMDTLVHLYPKLARGGFLIVDDYAIDSCRRAVEDYRRAQAITAPLVTIDWTGVYWRVP